MFRKPLNQPTLAATGDTSDASNAAPAANVSNASNSQPASSTQPSQSFGAARPGSSAAAAQSVSESWIYLPAQQNVQFSVWHFPEPNPSAKQADFSKVRETAELLLRREKPASEAKRSGQSQPIGVQQGLNLPQAQDAVARKPTKYRSKQVDPNEQPWLLDVKANAGAKRQQFRGTKQASITENAAYFLLLMGHQNESGVSGRSTFLAHPISEWYTFLPVAQYDHLDEDEAENLYQQRNRIQNLFGIMASRRLDRTREDRDTPDDGPSSSGGAAKRDEYAFLLEDDADKKAPAGNAKGGRAQRPGNSRGTDFTLLETADFSTSDEDESDADDNGADEKKPKPTIAVKSEAKAAAASKKPPTTTKPKPAANAAANLRKWKRDVDRRRDRRTNRFERARNRKKRIGYANEEGGDLEEGAYDEALEYDEENSDLDYDDVDEASDASDSPMHRVEAAQSDEEGPARRKREPDEAEVDEFQQADERGVQDDDAIRALNESESENEDEKNEEEKDENETAAAAARRRRRGESLSESSSDSSSSDGRAGSSSSAPSDAELDDLEAGGDYVAGAAPTAGGRKRRADGEEQVEEVANTSTSNNGKRGRFVDNESAAGNEDQAIPFGLSPSIVASVIGAGAASAVSPTKGKSSMDHKLEADIRRALWGGRVKLTDLLKRIRPVCRKMGLGDQQLADKIISVMRRLNVRETREFDGVHLELPING